MKKELEKNYDFQSVEDRIYQNWLDKKYFHAEVDQTKKPFTIVIPPPNVTGQLHMGHALDTTMQDILIRSKKMQGYNALWVPGCDHASISTEVKVVEAMEKEGVTKEALGREKFLERAWAWKETYGGRILKQLQKIGCACDWDRERFTMDEGLSDAVLEVFVRMYHEGKIYRGEKLINWCPKCQTTISDAEVEHEDRDTHFWHMKYRIDGTDEYLTFATTRPETLLGDTALAVNPEDARYTRYIGKTVTIPIVNRQIPVIGDAYVDMEMGTGIVKITPAHDPNDYEVGLRHNLPRINVMNDDGTMNENAGKYQGMDKLECRRLLVEEFKALGQLEKIEDLNHAVGVHERCGEIIEPMLKLQWFVEMETLARPALKAYQDKELNIIPDRFGKIYTNWLTNIRDWCISRQLWWGHRIPAYYCDTCKEMVVAKVKPDTCPKCGGSSFQQDEDVLDTWFSSALWPFSTLGWPEKTPEYEYFYPTSVLVTAYDILFFWVIRMVFSGLHHTGRLPFKDVLFHGLIRDSEGRKMSKSLGNGIDPLEVIDRYGADALRATLVMGTSPGNDSRFYWERVEANRNFLNKIWNATRFILMFDEEAEAQPPELTNVDKWILSKVNTLAKAVTEHLDSYEMGLAMTKLYSFIWDEFCDWYIEMVKPRLYNKEDATRSAALYTLKTVLINALKLMHPFMPFITEEIFTSVQDKEESLLTARWPFYEAQWHFAEAEAEVELIKNAVKNIRNIRAEMNVVPSKKIRVVLVTQDRAVKEIFTRGESFFKALAGADSMEIQAERDESLAGAVTSVIPNALICLPVAELVDLKKERERLMKEKAKLQGEIQRADGKLNNPGFLSKAPQPLIDEEKAKLAKFQEMLQKAEEQLIHLP